MRRSAVACAGVTLLLSVFFADAVADAVVPQRPTPAEALEAARRGVAHLVRTQNSEGSWGGAGQAVYTFTGSVWSNPETHHSWRVGTTGLACLALLMAETTPGIDSKVGRSDPATGISEAAPAGREERPGDSTSKAEPVGLPQIIAAADRSIEYLTTSGHVLRPSDWDTMDCWAHIYGLQALAVAHGVPRYQSKRAELRKAAERMIGRLEKTQSPNGGWGYLEFDAPRTPRLQWATSFTTGAAIVALLEAKKQGIEFDEKLLERALRAVEHCRLPNGAYTYSIPVIPDPRRTEWIDNVKGSLSRIQVCNVAIVRSGRELPLERMRVGLTQFFREHRFLDIARNKPIPHETYYYNSGYFYLFGHYYGALAIEHLPPAERPDARSRLWHEIMKTQQADGSMWDYDMHRYHKPYGTAFGVLGLAAGLQAGGESIDAGVETSAGARPNRR